MLFVRPIFDGKIMSRVAVTTKLGTIIREFPANTPVKEIEKVAIEEGVTKLDWGRYNDIINSNTNRNS